MQWSIGDKTGMLTILERKVKGNRSYYLCHCECGNERWIRSDSLKKAKSCGCLSVQTRFKAMDLVGKRFGRLTVLRKTDKKLPYSNCAVWECRCDCNNICFVFTSGLIRGSVSSCGCLAKDVSRQTIQKAIKVQKEKYIVYDTNLHMIGAGLLSTNTSGTKGVAWDKSRNKWLARIIFRKKTYNLGRFSDKEEAIKARKAAEKELHGEFLKWYHSLKKEDD